MPLLTQPSFPPQLATAADFRDAWVNESTIMALISHTGKAPRFYGASMITVGERLNILDWCDCPTLPPPCA